MLVEPSSKPASPGLVVWCRFWVAKFFYRISFALVLRDASWQEDLFASLAPKEDDRILDLGKGSSSSAISLALRYPKANFVIVDPNSKAAERSRLRALREKIENITVLQASLPGKLPMNAGSFDAAICIFALHDSLPTEKVSIIKEIVRVLRHGGTLRVVDFDKPENPREGRILELGGRISGAAAVAPHFNGSWVSLLAKAGLTGTIRLSSHTIGSARISIVKARKR